MYETLTGHLDGRENLFDVSAQGERYLGMTTDLKERLQEHNAGKSSHTSKFKPRQKLSNAISNLVQGTLSLVSDYGNSV